MGRLKLRALLMNPGDVIGNYKVVRLLGQGGMGAVYEAIHTTIERRVALKVLHDELAHDREAMNRFFNEARATNRIDHPCIVQVSDFGNTEKGAGYLVMEFLRGCSLAKRLEELQAHKGSMDLATALQVAWQVAHALTAAHGAGIVHRDLKPENLMLVEDPVAPGGERVKILDFGIAKLMGTPTGNNARTAATAVFGTPMYMSPEQCAGAGGVDEKTDVYALGAILYEMLSGRTLFEAEGVAPMLLAQMSQQPKPLQSVAPRVPVDVAQFVHRLLVKEKIGRPDMRQVQQTLSELLLNLSGTVPALGRRPSGAIALADLASLRRTSRGSRRKSLEKLLRGASAHRGLLAAVGIGCIALLALGILLVRKPHAPSPDAANKTDASKPALNATPPKPEPTSIRWTLASEPPGADVIDEKGEVLGKTPWTQQVDRGSGESRLRLQKKGYDEASLTLPRDKDSERTVTLTAATRGKKKKKKNDLELVD